MIDHDAIDDSSRMNRSRRELGQRVHAGDRHSAVWQAVYGSTVYARVFPAEILLLCCVVLSLVIACVL
jgi:hypothetical protein